MKAKKPTKLTAVYELHEFKDPNNKNPYAITNQGRMYSSFDYIVDKVIPKYMQDNCPLFAFIPFQWDGFKGIFFTKKHPSKIEIAIHKHYLWDVIEG